MPPVNIPDEFPVPLAAFLARIAKTDDEVWSKFLSLKHGREKRMMFEWIAALDELKKS